MVSDLPVLISTHELFSAFFSHFLVDGEGVIERLVGHLVANQGQPTTDALFCFFSESELWHQPIFLMGCTSPCKLGFPFGCIAKEEDRARIGDIRPLNCSVHIHRNKLIA